MAKSSDGTSGEPGQGPTEDEALEALASARLRLDQRGRVPLWPCAICDLNAPGQEFVMVQVAETGKSKAPMTLSASQPLASSDRSFLVYRTEEAAYLKFLCKNRQTEPGKCQEDQAGRSVHIGCFTIERDLAGR